MNCKKCGTTITAGMAFCPECGQPVGTEFCVSCGAAIMPEDAFCQECGTPVSRQGRGFEQNQYAGQSQYYRPKRNNNNNILIISLCALVAILVICIATFFIVKEFNTNDAPITETQNNVEENSENYVVTGKNVEQVINDVINAYSAQNNISVAVIDNITGDKFSSYNPGNSYTAWGLYLPIYLLYGQYSGYNGSVREGIMSSDAATCNNNANRALRDMGGLGEVTRNLSQSYGATNTSYGRFFGETNAYSDNYTTANDAVLFLRALNNAGQYSKLSYNIGSFGITPPAGANVYAHAGTENRNVRNDLNLFAIVKGARSDYCVAILTRNYNGQYITQLLQTIHNEMER